VDPENESTMEVLQSTKKDLDRLREYAFRVVRRTFVGLFNTLFKIRLSVRRKTGKKRPFDFLFFSFFFLKKNKNSDFFPSKNVKERNVFLLNEYHHSKPKKAKPWPEDILRIRATIYKQRHVHSKHIKRKSKKSSSASQNLLEEEKEMAPTAPCSMTTSRTTTNNISSKSANDTKCNTTTYSSEESVEMSGADTAFNHHQMVDVSCGTRTLTSDAETNTYLNNSYAFIIENNEMSSGYIENEDDHCDDEDQHQTRRGHPSLPPSFKNTHTKTKMMYTTTSAANSEYSSGSGVDFFNVTAPNFIINNDNNENGQNSVGGRKRKKPTSSFSAARSKLSKRAAANNNFKKGGETEEEQPSNTALANSGFSTPHMLNMDAIFGIDGSVERDDEDTALSPNSYGITIASFKETKRM